MSFKAPRGTKDIFGEDIFFWQKVECILRNICESFCISEIRTPVFEQTELFQRGVGETTDIVTKEMYTLEKKAVKVLRSNRRERLARRGLLSRTVCTRIHNPRNYII